MTDLTAFLDALDRRMNDWMQKFGVVDPAPMLALQNMIRGARDDIAAVPTVEEICDAMAPGVAALRAEIATPALGWSEWLEWAGGPCPLPANVPVEWDFPGPRGQTVEEAGYWDWPQRAGKRFCYREDAPGGWVERGDFIPPAWLWGEACPVRCEWTMGLDQAHLPGAMRLVHSGWDGITHIRLVAREKAGDACEMPEGWSINGLNELIMPNGRIAFVQWHYAHYGPDTIRRAVDAWLASMKERGNG